MIENCIKKASVFIAYFSLIAGIGLYNLTAEEYIFGGKNGWQQLQKEENISKGKGRFGYECIEIAPNSFVFDDYTDLLIDFENTENPISDGYYELVKNSLKITDKTKMEKKAGLSRNLGSLSVKGKPGTFFGTEGLMGSFAIEFWLCPSIAENGEVIFNWESSKNVRNRLVTQMINAAFKNGHLEWHLTNLFDLYSNNISNPRNLSDIVLKGAVNIIPDEWSYHSLSYDCETGLLEYLVNGVTEDLLYVTSDGTENGEMFLVLLGTPGEVQFCSEYTGAIDDIRILRRPYSAPDFQSAENAGKLGHTQFIPAGGRFVTKPIMLSTGAVINRVDAVMDKPAQTENHTAALLSKLQSKTIVAINKTDLPSSHPDKIRNFLKEALPKIPENHIFEMSAQNDVGINEVLKGIYDISPEGEPMYDEDLYTDQDLTFRVCEVIRGEAINRLEQEIPHAVYVDVADVEHRNEGKKLWIRAFLCVERDSQKGIVIGKGASKIKEIRMASIKKLSEIYVQKIDLDLQVKVDKNWRQRDFTINKLIPTDK